MKTCSKCQQPKPEAEFNKGRRFRDGLQPWCRQCQRSADSGPYAQERRRAYYQRNKTKLDARNKAWISENRERSYEIRRAWAKRNPDSRRLAIMRRYALKRGSAVTSFTLTDWQELVEKAGGCCAYCNQPAKLTQEHKTPLSRGGRHTKDNIVPACFSCNRRKGTKTLEEFLSE